MPNIEYCVVERKAYSLDTYLFEVKVKRCLREGWILQGGVSLCFSSETNQFIMLQAMTREL